MFKKEWEAKKELIETALLAELQRDEGLNKTLADSMKYSLMAGGKRLRPVLLMAAADAVGGNGEDYVTTAAAVEMIHTYSLVHDDLPCMDDDDYRRGKLTNHKIYGAGIATLAGDGLLTLAFEVMTRQKGVPSEVILAVIREMSIGAGTSGMLGGQVIDLESEGQKIDMPTLRRMHMGKTGALFKAALRCGALLAGASDEELLRLTVYAEHFGLAFQITDDILDVVGDAAVIGKPVGSDERNNKSTYVSLTSLPEAWDLARESVFQAKKALIPFGEKASFLNELADYLLSRAN